jgi:hypothetical protein
VTKILIQRAGLWPFARWTVREDASWGDLTEQTFRSRAEAVAHALDLADGDNLRVTVNGRPLDDG